MASKPPDPGGRLPVGPDREAPPEEPRGEPAPGELGASEELEAIAGRILEGEPIDWDSLPAPSDERWSRLLEELRALESLTGVHRSVQRSGARSASEWDLQRWGDLEIIEPVGRGSFGTVYHAWDPKLDREVALKILEPPGARSPGAEASDVSPPSPRTVARTIGEARLLAKVRHPNVVTVYGADEHDGRIGIWMELVEGNTLRSLVRQQGPFGEAEAAAIAHDLLGALGAAHAAGILHRDLKPANVMRAKDGRIVLMDFGLGRDLRAVPSDETESWALGAALYAAPERLHGGEATVRSDLYSLGVLLYYLLTGRHPFEGADYAQLLAAHEAGRRVSLRERRPDLSTAFVEVIERAARSDPAVRWSSAREVDRALSAAKAPAGWRSIRRKLRSLRRPSWLTRRRAALALTVPLAVLLAVSLSNLGRYRVEAGIYRALPRGGQASLVSQEGIGPGERIFLEFRASKDLYVYLLARNEEGSLRRMLPERKGAGPAPLSREVRHRLPRAPAGLEITRGDRGRAGRMQFVLVASPEPIAAFEAPAGASGLPAESVVAEDELIRVLGTGASAAGQRGDDSVERVLSMTKPLGPARESVRGLWVRKLEVVLLEP